MLPDIPKSSEQALAIVRSWPKGVEVKVGRKTKIGAEKESSSAYFERLRPKFLDWRPPTEEEKALEVKARREAKEAELKRVTDLAKQREMERAAMSRKRRGERNRRKLVMEK